MADVVAYDTSVHLPDADSHADAKAGLDGVGHGVADAACVAGRMVAFFALTLDDFKASSIHGRPLMLRRLLQLL